MRCVRLRGQQDVLPRASVSVAHCKVSPAAERKRAEKSGALTER